MDINFWGVVHGCRAFAPQLRSRPGCVIVNISSIYAMLSSPTQAFYNASKAAVRAFSDALREELRADGQHPGVQVLCVHPGGIRTQIAVNARLGDISALADNAQHLQRQFSELSRTSPQEAAERIVRALMQGRSRLLIGGDARVGDWIYRLNPARASAWFSALVRAARRRNLRQGGGA
jgi:short-subunit dehydrogenase